jgi:hypothetical protein
VRESLTLNRSAGDGPGWVSEGPIVPRKPGNAGRGKGPWFCVLRTEPRRGDWPPGNSREDPDAPEEALRQGQG